MRAHAEIREYQKITDDGEIIIVNILISAQSPSVNESGGAFSSGMRAESQEVQPNDDAIEVELEGEEFKENLGEVEQPQVVEPELSIGGIIPHRVIKPPSRFC